MTKHVNLIVWQTELLKRVESLEVLLDDVDQPVVAEVKHPQPGQAIHGSVADIRNLETEISF